MITNLFSKIILFFKKKKVYNIKDVFTPSTSASISYIPRENVEKKLNKALNIPGKQIVIYGHSGSGKTTILNHILIKHASPKITSRCTNNSSIESIIIDAFDELNPYYIESSNNSSKQTISSNLTTEYLGIKSSITGTSELGISEIRKRVLPPQLTIQRLCDFIGSANAIWIIEDFHKVPDSEKSKISQMMKLFMDKASDYPNSKIIVLGAADYGYEVVKYDKELNNRIAEIEVPLLSPSEIIKIIEKGSEVLNIKISLNLSQKIADYANCLATIAHQLAYNLCYNNGIYKTQIKQMVIKDSELEQAITDFTSEKQDTYKTLYMNITEQREGKYKNNEIILTTLCEMTDNGITQHDLFIEIKKSNPNYPQGNLSVYLKKLYSPECEEVLRNNSGRISFSDPFFKSYVKMIKVKGL